jgi:peptidoglycan hydrolase CwlO-like protein
MDCLDTKNANPRGGENMARTVMIAGVIAMLFVGIGSVTFPVSPAGAAEMMQADKAMMKATGEDLMALKKEIAAIQADLEKLTKRTASMSKMMDKAASNYCSSVPDSLKAAGFAPGLCK